MLLVFEDQKHCDSGALTAEAPVCLGAFTVVVLVVVVVPNP